MIAFAFVDADGISTGGGMKPTLPDGAVELTPPFTTLDLPRLMYRDGAWAERPALPVAVASKYGFELSGLPDVGVVEWTDIGTGHTETSEVLAAEFHCPLPEDCTVNVTVTAPLPWLGSSVIITRGKGSAEIAAQRLATARAAAIARVNERAGALRLKVYTDIPGQDALYLEKRAEALAFVANPKDADLAYFPLLAGEVGPGLTATTAYELAQIWLNRSHLFKLVGGATETARLRAAYAIAAAPDEDAITAIERGFIEALARLPI